MASDLQVSKLPSGWVEPYFSETWKLMKENYVLVFVPCFITAVIPVLFASLGVIGSFIAGVLGVLLLSGQIRIYFALLNGEKKEIPEMFTPLSDGKLFKALVPLIVWKVAVSVLVTLSPGFGSALLSVVGDLLVLFSNQLITVRGVGFFDTLQLNFKAIAENWLEFLWFLLIVIAAVIAGTLALVLPVFFIVLPLVSLIWVRVYKGIFHDSSGVSAQV